MAGMTPVLFETSTQALILLPLVISMYLVYTSTQLILMLPPSVYAILEDFWFVKPASSETIKPLKAN